MATKKKAAAKKAPVKKPVAAKKAAPAKKAAKRKPNAAFMKALTPSATLAAVVGSAPLPRTEVTKKLMPFPCTRATTQFIFSMRKRVF